MSVGYLTTLVVNPDLDLNSRAPKGIKKLWWLYWWPYSRLIGHRSPLSHCPIIGTLIRVAYLLVPIVVLAGLLKIPLIVKDYYFYILLAMIISDIAHVTLDVTITRIKRWI